MNGWSILGIILISAMTTGANPTIKCLSVGSWGCSEEGICIDSGRGAGQKFAFDVKKMQYSAAKIQGKIISRGTNDRGQEIFRLSDGRLFTYTGKSNESFLSDGSGSSLALRCKS